MAHRNGESGEVSGQASVFWPVAIFDHLASGETVTMTTTPGGPQAFRKVGEEDFAILLNGKLRTVRAMLVEDGQHRIQRILNEREHALILALDGEVKSRTVAIQNSGTDRQQLEATGRLVSYGIHFNTGSSDILPQSESVLTAVLAFLKEHRESAVLIEGHTDSMGDDQHNIELSRVRAAKVKDYLVAKGIVADRLTANGRGATQPIGDNNTLEGRAQNRRVVFQVLGR